MSYPDTVRWPKLSLVFFRAQAKKMNVESLRANQNVGAQSAEIRIAKAALTVCFLFVASWTPYGVMALIGAFGDQQLLTPGVFYYLFQHYISVVKQRTLSFFKSVSEFYSETIILKAN